MVYVRGSALALKVIHMPRPGWRGTRDPVQPSASLHERVRVAVTRRPSRHPAWVGTSCGGAAAVARASRSAASRSLPPACLCTQGGGG
eukprot:scaffold82290_cov51-Phaeocystis_antarctica.AAC.1